jgi:hypothetical protein
MTTFLDLTQSLMQEKRPDLALKVLHKYDEVMPDINPFIDVVARKFYLAQACYTLHDVVLGKKFVTGMDDYLTDQLNYYYYLLQNNGNGLSARDISISIQLIGGMLDFAKDAHQTDLFNKLSDQYKDYQTKFASVLNSRQQ